MRNLVRPPQPRRVYNYTWFRLDGGFPWHPKWKMVSDMSGAPVGNVLSVVATILCNANGGKPRGSVAGFRVFECSRNLGYDPGQVQTIYDALCDPRIGFIHEGFVLDWEQRNPGSEDTTNAERQRRYRERQKLAREAEAAALRNGSNGHNVTPVTQPADHTSPRNGSNGASVTRDWLDFSGKNAGRNGSNAVTSNVTAVTYKQTKEDRESLVALAHPVETGNSGDCGEISPPPGSQTFEEKKQNEPQRSLASAPLEGALTRAAKPGPVAKGLGKGKFSFADAELDEAKLERIAARVLGRPTGAIDEADEEALRRLGINPILPNPFEGVARVKPQPAEQTREALLEQLDYLRDGLKGTRQ